MLCVQVLATLVLARMELPPIAAGSVPARSYSSITSIPPLAALRPGAKSIMIVTYEVSYLLFFALTTAVCAMLRSTSTTHSED